MQIGVVFLFICVHVFSSVNECKQCLDLNTFNKYCPTNNKCSSPGYANNCDRHNVIEWKSKCQCLSQERNKDCFECVKDMSCSWDPKKSKCLGSNYNGGKDVIHFKSQCEENISHISPWIIIIPVVFFLMFVGGIVACCVLGCCVCSNATRRRPPVRAFQQPQIHIAPQANYEVQPQAPMMMPARGIAPQQNQNLQVQTQPPQENSAGFL